MRWFLVMLLALALALAWWLSSRQSPPPVKQETAHETSSASRDSEDPRDHARKQAVPNIPALPMGADIRFDTSLRPPDDEPQSRIKREWERDRREEFAEMFSSFRRDAALTDAQAKEMLLALYDFQETFQAALAASENASEANRERASIALDQAYPDGLDRAMERIRDVLRPEQYDAWWELAIADGWMPRLVFDAPLVPDAGR